MTVDRRVSSIESSFKMESMPFDAECRQRVRNVLTKKVSATDAISELNKKYRVSKKQVERDQEYDYWFICGLQGCNHCQVSGGLPLSTGYYLAK